MVISKRLLYFKALCTIMMFFATVWYMSLYANLKIINIKLLQSLIMFLNDLNPKSNILEYVAILIIKLIFNVDIHDLQSFFDNINPIFK